MMKLADDITIELGGERVTLRPTLRCAIRFESRPGSFSSLLGQISDGSLSSAINCIQPHHDHPFLKNQIMDAGLDSLMDPLTRYVMACAGIDPDDPPKKANGKGKTVTFKKHLEDLFRIGTGWLGWTPDETLDATPAEITLAYEGRLEMLKAIFGGSDKPDNKSNLSLDDQFKGALGSFDTTKVKRPKRKAAT